MPCVNRPKPAPPSALSSTSFYALVSALLRVKRLDLDESQNFEKLALQQAASQCQRTIDDFWMKVQKYQPHLRQGGTHSRLKDGWAKIKWAVCKKADVETFQTEIRGHTSSIIILLQTVQIGATAICQSKADLQHKNLASKTENVSCQVMQRLSLIADGVAQCAQQGKTLLESIAQIVQINLRVFQVIHDIQLFIHKIPGQVQRQQPVYMIDAFNKECPFHLEFIQSAEAFLAVLKINLKEPGCGPEMIDRAEFVIEETGKHTLIDITQQWDTCFYPGQGVAMSMVFRQRAEGLSCPQCKAPHNKSTGEEISCTICGTVFHRIEEVFNPWSLIGLESFEFLLNELWSFRNHLDDDLHHEDNNLNNIRKFRRLRIICQKRRVEGKGYVFRFLEQTFGQMFDQMSDERLQRLFITVNRVELQHNQTEEIGTSFKLV